MSKPTENRSCDPKSHRGFDSRPLRSLEIQVDSGVGRIHNENDLGSHCRFSTGKERCFWAAFFMRSSRSPREP